MGLGDEIMALGRAEQIFQETGQPVKICRWGGYAREHDAWKGNPAVCSEASQEIYDCAGFRGYIKKWQGRRAVYDLTYRPRAGKIWLTDEEKAFCQIEGDFVVIAPTVKANASPNKDWGVQNWEAVIKGFPVPVYQLLEKETDQPIKGAIGLFTPHFRLAAAVIAKARLVLCNEGGSHHMAASMGVPAVVIFGSFVPPFVTGYPFHVNISVETNHGYCGDFDYCKECQAALKTISPDYVRQAALEVLNG